MRYIIFTVLTLVCLGCKIRESKINPGKKIYLLMGQSNMAGRGVLTDDYRNLQNIRVLMLNANNEWVIAKNPVHFDKPKAAGVGPGLAFGMGLAIAFPKDTIYLVPCAVGGTSISKWEPGAFDEATNTHPYDDALLRIKEAMKIGKISGAIWLQGESDSNPKSSLTYLAKLTVLIERVRGVTENRKLPFVVGELGQYNNDYKLINTEIHKLPVTVSHTGIVTSEGLIDKGDNTHFNSASATIYGARFAVGMLKLQKK